MQIYWGDIHNHCGITYGFGSLENALNAAKEQLDFCSITGHAMWPDIPERKEGTEFLVDFHQRGFQKLRDHWETVRKTVERANNPHEFVTFHGYEMHSAQYGDHHILSPSPTLPLIEAGSPAELVQKLAPHPTIAILHHAGYTPGYRGANWEAFSNTVTPVVEVYSKHGCGMSDDSSYPYLHTMGPRDSRSTIYNGLKAGHRFGFVASTDHHAGYPGSYGDGRLAVLAQEKTRESIWEAILARRTYAVTGDKILCHFSINGAPFGSEIKASGSRQIALDVTACDRIDKIVIYKNQKPWHIINGENVGKDNKKAQSYKVRVEMGWGNSEEGYDWEGKVNIKDGSFLSVEPCFRGRSVLAPTPEMKENPNINALDNRIVNQNESEVTWVCTTVKNPTTQHAQTAAVILEIEGNEKTVLDVQVNGKRMVLSIDELLNGSRSWHTKPYSSEAVLIHGAVPDTQYTFCGKWEDREKVADCDVYHAEIRQMNGQCAWISPVFVVE